MTTPTPAGKPDQAKQPQAPKQKVQEVKVSGDPKTTPKTRDYLHGPIVGGAVYLSQLTQSLHGERKEFDEESWKMIADTAIEYADALTRRMNPRDPLEEMLVMQALWTHRRIAHLTQLACQQTRLETIRTIHEYCDRASNTYRRHMLALAEYRRPLRTGDTFTAIKQTNIAGQQIVQNPPQEKSPNEQGSPHETPTSQAPKALPSDAGGPVIPADFRPAQQTLDEIHRPQNPNRQNPIPPQRSETW